MLPFDRVMELTVNGAITLMTNVLDADNDGEPLSVTRTVTELLAPVCAEVVLHVNRPLAELIEAPGGAPGSRLNASVCDGISVSLATFVKVNVAPACTD